mmetsp:Transcript_49937/g.120979  ORF Transcript_49937/g.120979 Transcript_49937/m.120979 type:complete len:153 (-) Transcript_49937:2235-2693(-)
MIAAAPAAATAVTTAKVWSRPLSFSTILSTTVFHRRISCLSTLTTTEYGAIRRRGRMRRRGDTHDVREYHRAVSSLLTVRSNPMLIAATPPNILVTSYTNRISSEGMIQITPRRSYFGYDGPKRQQQQQPEKKKQEKHHQPINQGPVPWDGR